MQNYSIIQNISLSRTYIPAVPIVGPIFMYIIKCTMNVYKCEQYKHLL